MKYADNIETLELKMNVFGKENVIYPTLIWDNDTVVLVDTGFPGQLNSIRDAMDKIGVSFDKLSKVIITHQDIDHIGSLPDAVQAGYKKIDVLAHQEEKPYIEGDKPLIKMNPQRLEKILESIPEEHREKFSAIFKNPPKANVDITVSDDQVLPYCGGITVIHTPGHTPGHICLYHNWSKTLIAGDALFFTNGKLLGPRPQVTEDVTLATNSLKKFAEYDIEVVICYHGGVYQDEHINKRIAELANEKIT